ncbi:MAG: amidohydrolase, partial [Clostridia bacterium]|nr:amidohydrolase [Clostridia bacterium]
MKTQDKKKRICREIEHIAKQADEIATKINILAEPPLHEYQSSKLIADFLEQHGFKVSFCFKNISTAFRAERGRGKPSVGILGEYDALPNCGPKEGEMGHGCGHSLLGVGSAAGAIAAAEILKSKGITGKIVYYGCPAEETLVGKVYMARDGAFRELEACIAWHPSSDTAASYHGGSALDSVFYEFFGKTAHAAIPVYGKSALDAAIIFDVAVNYLRETVPENVRIHSVIVDGGDAPNVVPAYAKSWYYIRAKDREQVDNIRKLVDDCARGAAIATQTRYKSTMVTAIYNRLPNDAIFELIHKNLNIFGSTRVTQADKKNLKKLGLTGDFNGKVTPAKKGEPGRASSDEDTVSRLTPLGRFNMTTHAKGTPGHHRSLAAQMALHDSEVHR